MKRLGIKYQILLITFIPAFLIDAYFTYSHVSSSITQAQQILQNKGRIFTRQIAGASEFYLFSGNDQQIENILRQTVGRDDIVMAAVYDNQSENVIRAETDEYDPDRTADYYHAYQLITSQSIVESDVFSPEQRDEPQNNTLGSIHIYFSRDRLEADQLSLIQKSFVFFILVLVITLVLTIVISRAFTRPIYRIIEHLRKVETGHLGESIEPVEFNEIGALQKGFNRMTQALVTSRRHLNERIQQATQQLSEAITHLEAKNRELGFARDEAQHANKIKSQFLANMSHEIRTPINGIKGFINLLAESELTPSQRRYIDIILKSTNELTSIIEEILDFSKLESGKLKIVETDFDLHEIIEQTRDILFINVISKNIDLILIIYSDTPKTVCGDRVRLRQVLLNIIGNAIKFTDEGQVVVRVQLEQQTVDQAEILFTVEDSGIGISKEDQQELFQAFSQVESESNRRYSGTGLGLVISKNLVNLMGGDITLESRPQEGSRFNIRIPFSLPANSEQEVIPETPLNAMLFASSSLCLQEIQTLFDRAEVTTETNLMDHQDPVDAIAQVIEQNRAFIDIVAIDLRHFDIDLAKLVGTGRLSELRVMVMHYDQSLVTERQIAAFEFVPVVTSASDLHEIIYHAENRDSQVPDVERPVAPGDSKKVLLVDDNQINLTLGCELIRHWGHHAIAAEHAREAIEQYRNSDFDLIILDIQMPDIDGMELLNMMREEKPRDSTPIVALTANTMPDEAKRFIEHGFDYYLGKPIDEEKLRAILDGEHSIDKVQFLTDAEEPEEESISLDLEKSLSLCANNEALLRQIFEILLREIPVYQQQLEQTLQRPDIKKASLLAHKIHGVTCYASLPRARQLVIELQQSIASSSYNDTSATIQAIIDELTRIESSVTEYMETEVMAAG